jgi:hypothetical protein
LISFIGKKDVVTESRIHRVRRVQNWVTNYNGVDARRDVVAGLERPLIEPNPQPILPQPLRQRAHDGLVLRAVAEEGVVGEECATQAVIRKFSKRQL